MKRILFRVLAGLAVLVGAFAVFLYWDLNKPGPMRHWEPDRLLNEVGPMPEAGQFPATGPRLDLMVAPKDDMYPAMRNDPEMAATINRTMIIKGQIATRDPFVEGTRPAGPDEEWDEKITTRR